MPTAFLLLSLAGAPAQPPTRAPLSLDCTRPTHRIDPRIFGVAYYPLTDAKDGHLWRLGATARRWGGNHTTRYNWRLGNAWNTGADWFFRNVDYIGRPGYSWRDFLSENEARGVGSALVVPMIGWVAKDSRSSGFPVSRFGSQRAVDPYHPDAGDGVRKDGQLIPPGPPELTSIAQSPADVGDWVRAIRAEGHNVAFYILDNEPELWHQNHRDVHPEPIGYDELLERTIAYASAIRAADPKAVIAGPAAWGWPAYFYSAKDSIAGFRRAPDRRAHGDVPLLEWYLQKLREHERQSGVRLLDVLDVHFYPQEVPRDAVDAATRARRLRATRSLWDPAYVDESWIGERVQLLPRLSRLVAERYPGRGVMIGEYNFGGEQDPSGALALAEVLGRFSQHPGLTAAFYWTYPAAGTPAFHAFRAYRDYDGKGSSFPAQALPTRAGSGVSLFAARDEQSGRVVAVVLNLSPNEPRAADLGLDGCAARGVRAFAYAGGAEGLVSAAAQLASGRVQVTLPPYSITVLEVASAVTPAAVAPD